MNMTTKNNIFEEHKREYFSATKKRKGEILRSICAVAKMAAKSAIRKMRRLQTRPPSAPETRGRKTYYTNDVTAALKDVWEAASRPCGENLFPVIREYVRSMQKFGHWKHGDEVTGKLLAMSEGTVKNRTDGLSEKYGKMKGRSTTVASALHSLIPVRGGPWESVSTGVEQADTVAHCGESTAGDYAYTLNVTDVAALWGRRRAQWNKGSVATLDNIKKIVFESPFPITEIHPDSGGEFINWHCYGWCVEKRIFLTRSRPYKKNDNCFVEERNGHIVRRYVGGWRLDVPEVVPALNDLYDVLDPYLNHFAANKRIVEKKLAGSKWKKIREKHAKTPYERLLERNDVSRGVKKRLTEEHEALDPFLLKSEIDRRVKRVFDIQKRHGKLGY